MESISLPTDHSPGKPLEVIVWGEYACYTRPEAKAERVSYHVPTPSGVRGMLEAILWKPEFNYRIREIHVLKPIRFVSLLRNEITDKMPVKMPVSRTTVPSPIDIAEKRTQRHTLALYDVAYRILTDIVLRPDVTDDPAKYRDQFRRRVKRGERFHQPYLGCREFAANFCAIEDTPEILRRETHNLQPIRQNLNLGLMLFDLAFPSNSDANFPLFFDAVLTQGILTVPEAEYETLSKLAGPWLPNASKREVSP
jgi:CRISPR-associated protein Cas5d